MERPQRLFHRIQMPQQLRNTHNRSNPNKLKIRTMGGNRERNPGGQFQHSQPTRTRCTRKTRIHPLPQQRYAYKQYPIGYSHALPHYKEIPHLCTRLAKNHVAKSTIKTRYTTISTQRSTSPITSN